MIFVSLMTNPLDLFTTTRYSYRVDERYFPTVLSLKLIRLCTLILTEHLAAMRLALVYVILVRAVSILLLLACLSETFYYRVLHRVKRTYLPQVQN